MRYNFILPDTGLQIKIFESVGIKFWYKKKFWIIHFVWNFLEVPIEKDLILQAIFFSNEIFYAHSNVPWSEDLSTKDICQRRNYTVKKSGYTLSIYTQEICVCLVFSLCLPVTVKRYSRCRNLKPGEDRMRRAQGCDEKLCYLLWTPKKCQ